MEKRVGMDGWTEEERRGGNILESESGAGGSACGWTVQGNFFEFGGFQRCGNFGQWEY